MQTWKAVQNMQVVSREEGAIVARLDDFQFDLEDHHIYGWRVKGMGVFGRSGGVASRFLDFIGRDVAFIGSESQLEWNERSRSKVAGRAWASRYVGMQAITRQGESLGAVQDLVIDVQGTEVTGVLLHGNQLVPVGSDMKMGPNALILKSPDVVVDLGSDDDEGKGEWWGRMLEALGVSGSDDSSPENE